MPANKTKTKKDSTNKVSRQPKLPSKSQETEESFEAKLAGVPSTTPVATIETTPTVLESSLPDTSVTPVEVEVESVRSVSGGWLVFSLALILGALFGGWLMYNQGFLDMERGEISTSSPTLSALPTSSPALDRPSFKIQVLNGSGVKGEAASVESILENNGIKVESTGNATTSSYLTTEIQAKKSVTQEFLERLKNILSETYSVGNTTNLADTEEIDIIVIVGKKNN
jgi:hypothetical protein